MLNVYIGSIVPSVVDLSSPRLLALNGQSVAVADYPELAAVVPAAWIVGADIVLPNLNDTGLFGTDDPVDAGSFIGENQHTLTENEMPAHTHIQNPHNHTEVIPTVIPTAAGLEPAFASLVTATPSLTGLATATNQNAGGSNPHNNIQFSMYTIFFIVAR